MCANCVRYPTTNLMNKFFSTKTSQLKGSKIHAILQFLLSLIALFIRFIILYESMHIFIKNFILEFISLVKLRTTSIINKRQFQFKEHSLYFNRNPLTQESYISKLANIPNSSVLYKITMISV
jgi:hypothetical protein